MTINGQPVSQFVAFWVPIPAPEDRSGEEGHEEFREDWADSVRSSIAALDSDALTLLAEDWRRQYEEVDTVRGDVASRANALLIVVGVLNGLALLSATAIAGAFWLWVVAFAAAGLLLVYAACATAFLALRAGQVRRWDRVHVSPADLAPGTDVARRRAFEFYFGWRRNALRLRDSVGYLRDAQTYALVTVVALASLAVAATLAALS